MAKKKPIRTVAAPAAAEVTRQPETPAPDTLLDWRFNLIVLGCMEVLLIMFALPREVERYRQTEAQKALWRGNYPRAFKLYYQLNRDDPSNAGYLKALGDAAMGRGQHATALDYYERATNNTFNSPEIKIQVGRIYDVMAQSEKDPKQKKTYLDASRKLFEMALREGPDDLKVNFWLGQYYANAGDLTEAAEFFSRVRADVLQPWVKPNEEEARLIADAKKALAQIQAIVFKDADFRLDLTGMVITSTPTLTATVAAPAATTAPLRLELTPASGVATPPGPLRPPAGTTATAPARAPTATPARAVIPRPVGQTTPTTVRPVAAPTMGTAVQTPPKP